MTTRSTRSRANVGAGASFPVAAPPLGQFGDIATSMAAAGQAYLEAVGKCQGELYEFISKRIATDVSHGQSLAACKDWSEAASANREWARRAVQDYAAEGEVLMKLASRAAATGMETLAAPLAENRK